MKKIYILIKHNHIFRFLFLIFNLKIRNFLIYRHISILEEKIEILKLYTPLNNLIWLENKKGFIFKSLHIYVSLEWKYLKLSKIWFMNLFEKSVFRLIKAGVLIWHRVRIVPYRLLCTVPYHTVVWWESGRYRTIFWFYG